MTLLEAIYSRHSVRSYDETKEIEADKLDSILKLVEKINSESGLHIQAVLNEPKAFDSFLAHYGKFNGIKNYLVLIGKESADLDELCGYYGEMLGLYIQSLGLNFCWVALTYKKVANAYKIEKGEKLICVIPFGYGVNEGNPHKSKELNVLSNISDNSPAWFKEGVIAASLAPTAINQQKFYLELIDNKVKAVYFKGPYAKVDLGIIKYHFEIGSNKDSSIWI